MTTPASSARAVTMPDKPSLDGLEDKWAQVWSRAGHLPLRPHAQPREEVYSIDTPPPDGRAARCTSATCSPTPTPTASPATSGCAATRSSTRWAGTTTACRPSAACRTTTACAATRRCRTTPTSAAARRRPDAQGRRPAADQPRATSSSCASGSPSRTRRSSRTLWRTLGLSVDWSITYTHHRRPLARDQPSGRSCATSRRGEAYQAGGADACGTSRSRPRSPRPSSRPASTPAPTTASPSTAPDGEPVLHRDHPPRAAPRRAWR